MTMDNPLLKDVPPSHGVTVAMPSTQGDQTFPGYPPIQGYPPTQGNPLAQGYPLQQVYPPQAQAGYNPHMPQQSYHAQEGYPVQDSQPPHEGYPPQQVSPTQLSYPPLAQMANPPATNVEYPESHEFGDFDDTYDTIPDQEHVYYNIAQDQATMNTSGEGT